jgi:hypothetical protein
MKYVMKIYKSFTYILKIKKQINTFVTNKRGAIKNILINCTCYIQLVNNI